MNKVIKILTLVSFLLLGSCGPNPNKQDEGENVNITSHFLTNNTGTFKAGEHVSGFATAERCNPVEGDNVDPDPMCFEEFEVSSTGVFSRSYIRSVGQKDSILLPEGTLCKWLEQGKIYHVNQLDPEAKNAPSGVTHFIYSTVSGILPDSNNPAQCSNFFGLSFTAYSLKIHAAISGTNTIQFFTYGEPKGRDSYGSEGSLSVGNTFEKIQ